MNRQSIADFYSNQTTLYDTMMVATHHYTFAHKMYNTKSDP